MEIMSKCKASLRQGLNQQNFSFCGEKQSHIQHFLSYNLLKVQKMSPFYLFSLIFTFVLLIVILVFVLLY